MRLLYPSVEPTLIFPWPEYGLANDEGVSSVVFIEFWRRNESLRVLQYILRGVC